MSRSLQASALLFAILSIGHTVSGREWTSDPRFRSIRGSRPWACGTVGWYQGSAFLAVASIIHYQWSNNPQALQEPLNKAIAGIVNAMLWSTSAWYFKNGVMDNGWAVVLSAALHAWSVATNAV